MENRNCEIMQMIRSDDLYKNISSLRRSRVPIKGTPRQLTCRGAPVLSFFYAGFPPHKNAACGYPQIYAFTSLYVLIQDVGTHGL